MVHDGVTRRSEDTSGGEDGSGEGTVMVIGMSGAVWRDIFRRVKIGS